MQDFCGYPLKNPPQIKRSTLVNARPMRSQAAFTQLKICDGPLSGLKPLKHKATSQATSQATSMGGNKKAHARYEHEPWCLSLAL